MTVEDLIKLEIEKCKSEIKRLEALIPNISGNAVKSCPRCGTENYHYMVKTNNWCCAFC